MDLISERLLPHLKLDVLPCPFLGNIEKAKVVVLLLNPGFEWQDLAFSMTHEKYYRECLASLKQESERPFFIFDKELGFSGGYRWWAKVTKKLIEDGVTLDDLSEKMMAVQYFPYPSVTYKGNKNILPSQNYSFYLVREAIRRKLPIVMMRSEKLWLDAVPELKEASYFKAHSSRATALSPNNLGEEEYQKILSALK